MRLKALLVAVAVVPLVAMLAGFAGPVGHPALGPAVVPVKLPFSQMSPEQVADLWRRADRYAEAEAFLKKCGQPSHIERRMLQAAGPCIEEAALRRVASYFRTRMLQFGQSKQFVCDSPQAKQVLKSVRAKIDSDVAEVRAMCAACFIC